MSDPKSWPRGVRVELNGQPWNPLKSALFLVAFAGLCLAIVAYRAVTGTR